MPRARASARWIGALLVVELLCASRTRADDIEVDSDTTLQAYDVESPATSVVWTRRRLTQSVGLRYVRALEESEGMRPPASIGAHVRLRLNQDFGDTCLIGDDLCFAVVNPSRRGSYTPLANDGVLDMPYAYVDARDLPHGTSVRAGRQLHYDVIGFTRIDGASVRAEPHGFFAAQGMFGSLVRSESVAGSDAFVPEGLPRLELDDLERRRAPYIEPSLTTWVAGMSVELGEERIVRGTASYRVLAADGGVIERRVGAGLRSRPLPELSFSTHGVLDTLDPGLIDAEAATELYLAPMRAHASLERHVPRFEPSSIWAYFDVAPVWIASLGTGRALTQGWDLSGAVRGRRTELSSGDEHDLGAEITNHLHDERNSLTLSGFGWGGGTGPLWGGGVSASRRITFAFTLEAEVSVMRVDDPLRAAMRGVSVYELLAARFALSEESDARIALSHAQSEGVGHRLALLAFLHLGAWR